MHILIFCCELHLFCPWLAFFGCRKICAIEPLPPTHIYIHTCVHIYIHCFLYIRIRLFIFICVFIDLFIFLFIIPFLCSLLNVTRCCMYLCRTALPPSLTWFVLYKGTVHFTSLLSLADTSSPQLFRIWAELTPFSFPRRQSDMQTRETFTHIQWTVK